MTDQVSETKTVETVEVDILANSMGENSPSVDTIPDAQEPTVTTPAADPQDGETPKDKNGVVHDPAIHASPPKLKKDGTWSLKRGRGATKWKQNDADKKAVNSHVHNPREVTAKMTGLAGMTDAKAVISDEEAKALAAECTAATIALGVLIGGPKFQPGAMKNQNGLNADQERGMLFGQYVTFIKEGNVRWTPPPWLGLAIGITSYVAPRFHEPEVKKHAKSRIWGWTSPIGRWWNKINAPKKERKKAKKEEAKKTGPQKEGPQKKSWAELNGFEGA